MSLFGRKAKLKWNGEQRELTITMELIDEIDDAVNVLKTAIELDKGGIPKVTLVAKVYAILLSNCGDYVSKEDVYESIMTNPANSAELVASARYALSLCFPEIDSSERVTSKKKK